jgi:uncharacterized protein YraI
LQLCAVHFDGLRADERFWHFNVQKNTVTMAKKVNKTTFEYGGVSLSLTKSKTQAAVRYNAGQRPVKKSTRRGAAMPPSQVGEFEVMRVSRNLDARLDQLRELPEVAVGSHVWEVDGADQPLIPTGKIYIEFIADSDVLAQRALLEDLHLSILEKVDDHAWRVATSPDSPNPIKCVVALQKKKKLVSVAEPEFATRPAEREFMQPTGRYVATQWHLENTGQQIPIIDIPNAVFGTSHFKSGADAKVKAAWRELGNLGNREIRIAVIDTGFAINHPQLKGDGTKVKAPYNAGERTSDVNPLFQYSDGSMGVASHGTSCAAVAAGAWDAEGVLGAAPNARIIPIKLDILSDDAIKAAFDHAVMNGADVISCSLGFPQPVPLSTFITNHLRSLIASGRGGRGIPMLFAAGNANPASNNQPRQASDFAAHPDAICVTASNSLDESSDYTFYGPMAWICAPTNGNDGIGITTATCDLAADQRSVALGYTSGFGGTSSATPLAAGIVALMYSANPDLRVADVRNILARSADKIGPSSAYNANGHSQHFGYGRINALRAVQMARAMAGGQPVPQPNNPGAPAPVPSPAPAPAVGMKGRVTSRILNVRTGPSTTNAKVRELKQGDVLDLIERVGGWWRISASHYVNADFVQVITLPPAPSVPSGGTANRTGKVSSIFVNVRSGPGTNFQKLGELRLGNSVTIFEQNAEGWYRIGEGRWVLGKYVRLT